MYLILDLCIIQVLGPVLVVRTIVIIYVYLDMSIYSVSLPCYSNKPSAPQPSVGCNFSHHGIRAKDFKLKLHSIMMDRGSSIRN